MSPACLAKCSWNKIELSKILDFTIFYIITIYSIFRFLSSSKVVWINQIHAVILPSWFASAQTSAQFFFQQKSIKIFYAQFCEVNLCTIFSTFFLHRSKILFKVLLLDQLKKFSHRKLCKNFTMSAKLKWLNF